MRRPVTSWRPRAWRRAPTRAAVRCCAVSVPVRARYEEQRERREAPAWSAAWARCAASEERREPPAWDAARPRAPAAARRGGSRAGCRAAVASAAGQGPCAGSRRAAGQSWAARAAARHGCRAAALLRAVRRAASAGPQAELCCPADVRCRAPGSADEHRLRCSWERAAAVVPAARCLAAAGAQQPSDRVAWVATAVARGSAGCSRPAAEDARSRSAVFRQMARADSAASRVPGDCPHPGERSGPVPAAVLAGSAHCSPPRSPRLDDLPSLPVRSGTSGRHAALSAPAVPRLRAADLAGAWPFRTVLYESPDRDAR